MFVLNVSRQIEAAHHNGPPGNRCQTNHGHSWLISVQFTYTDANLNAFGWGPDFGKIKAIIDAYDHKDLNQELSIPPSAENFAKTIFDRLHVELGFIPDWVEIEEGKGNKVRYTG